MTTRASLREHTADIINSFYATDNPDEFEADTDRAVDEIMAPLDHELRTLDNINMCARAEAPVEYIDPVSGKKLYNQAYLDREIAAAEKSYGGCHKCYGKGYATTIDYTSGYGTDGDIGGYEGLIRFKNDVMRFCTCDRGKQLKQLIQAEKAQ